MIGYWFLAVTAVAVVFIFKNGLPFALCFFGTAMLPSIAVAGMKWGLVFGDNQQKVGVPIIAVLLLGFAYWLSEAVSLNINNAHVSGFALLIFSAAIGLVGIPASWGSR